METFKATNPRTWRTPRRRQALGGLHSLATLREGAVHHGIKGLAIARYREIGCFVMQLVRLDKLACRIFVLNGHQLQGKVAIRLGLQPSRTVHRSFNGLCCFSFFSGRLGWYCGLDCDLGLGRCSRHRRGWLRGLFRGWRGFRQSRLADRSRTLGREGDRLYYTGRFGR